MIYPSVLSKEQSSNYPEKRVHDCLKKLSEKYDVFYSKRFIGATEGEKVEYEIDFIVALPNEAILVLEVKGGTIKYDGERDIWIQSGRELKKDPIKQVTSASHSLVKRYSSLSSKVPVGWALVFPESELPAHFATPTNISRQQIIDQNNLLSIEDAIENAIAFWASKLTSKIGSKHHEYTNFKESILRSIGFVKRLGTRIKHDENALIKLSERQVNVFKSALGNKKIVVEGVAGSGKTLLAKSLAMEFAEQKLNTLLLCYNRTLSKRLSYDTKSKYNDFLTVTRFHSYARRIITKFDETWWDRQKKDDQFWELDIAIKLEEISGLVSSKLDAIIIDEAQDFKSLWLDVLMKFLKPDGRVIVFVDSDQDIFGRDFSIIDKQNFTTYSLFENCRNTKKIVDHLSGYTKKEITPYEDSPEGEKVETNSFNNKQELQSSLKELLLDLVGPQNLDFEQIILLLNSTKKDSSIAEWTNVGKYDLRSLPDNGRWFKRTFHFTTINTFKGLESDIVIIIDAQLAEKKELYTQLSRAKHKLLIFELSK